MPLPFFSASGSSARRPRTLVQSLGLMLVFALVGYGFYAHFQNQIGKIVQSKAMRIDQTNTLTAEQEQELAEFQKAFRKAYSVSLVIRVVHEDIADISFFSEQAPTPGIGIGLRPCGPPEASRVRVEATPLVRAALGDEPIATMVALLEASMEGNGTPQVAGEEQGDLNAHRCMVALWPEGLKNALTVLVEELDIRMAKWQQENKEKP